MKLKIFSLFVASLLVFGSCTEQEIIEVPVQTGDEIHFGLSTPDKVGTRTIYDTPQQSEPDGNGNSYWYFPVYWEQDDEIAIYCPQASQPASQLVNYKITPDDDNPATSSAVTKIDEDAPGLQWGTDDEHRFYGFYPAKAVLGTETDGRIKGNIPVEQNVVKWEKIEATDGTITYNGVPDTDLAYMFAYQSVKKSELVNNPDIPLKFKPLVTILEVEVNGPKSGSSVKVTNINVTSSNGTPLAGNFECLISDQSGDCTPINDATVTNRVSVSCYNNNDFIELGVGDKLKVKLFLLPETGVDIEKGSLKVTVSTLNGAAKTKTLQTADVLSQRVNRVSLPALAANDDTNYWMSNLDKDIYFTELSIPGSHQSVGLEDEGSYEKYQIATIEQQFRDGIRAFSFQTVYHRGILFREDRVNVFASGREKDELYTYLQQISEVLDELKAENPDNREFALVSIVWKNYNVSNNVNDWCEILSNELNKDEKYQNLPIYRDRIDANTTIDDLKGKIVLRIDRPSTYDMPGLVSECPSTPINETVAIVEYPMHWQNASGNNQVLTFYAHDGTSIDVDGNSSGEIENLDTKLSYVEEIFNKSVDLYKANDAHNYFYHTNIGGFYCLSTSTQSLGGHTVQYTKDIMPSVTDFIQRRGQDASLGVVLMNFADKRGGSGADYGCDALIQTIIDNNFKFALRKKPSGTTQTYNASYSNGGNAIGWDN